ncbi:hypothetical protein [Hyperthermus butylicus]|uniref:Conserved crenarchaeal protein n=1 Tax=Hyperthermus butylicus (strain DSM 5456 / JCM 9403 / PLM1-5) TaxID=415426 RepID=A2BKY0_HYPBU|nr:hypothetical protein [Hyperthermus butylicus]ABM80641.1 conserved crenarchaeal protein [Hyperthermus butylicus DSM 5456]
MPLIDYRQAARVAEVFKPIVKSYASSPDTFTDPRFYPEPSADSETVALYFLVMVAMDHRLSRPGRPYEAVIDGEKFHGADLLYRLGMLKLERDPDFFTADRLERITPEEVRAWLCVGSVCPPDPALRASLLRDLGRKLRLLYGGSALRLLEESRGLLHSWDPDSPGFVERLRVFEAYGDPVEKKAMLLAKFLERRGLLRIRDPWNKRVPVDNHVVRIALRLGLVVLEEPLRIKAERKEDFTPWEDIAVRIAVREAWHYVATRTEVDDFLLDDILWTMGRKVCIHGRPKCSNCQSHIICRGGSRCLLAGICPVGLGAAEAIDEPVFYDTWWY